MHRISAPSGTFTAWGGLLLAGLLPVLGCQVAAPPAPALVPSDEVTLHVVLTADFHGHLTAQTLSLPGERTVELGGSALFGGYVANLRRASPGRVLLLDAGDDFAGSLEADTFQGRPVVQLFRLLGYDAAALGNHEFDFGPGRLTELLQEASHPVLAANVLDALRDEPATKLGIRPTLLLERGGVLVGIVGLASTETPMTTLPRYTEGLRFVALAPVLSARAAELRQAGAQVVIGLLHDGGDCRGAGELDDLTGCEADSPIFQLARELPAGSVDLLAGGHTHGTVARRVAGIPVVVPGALGRSFGRVDLVLSRRQGRVLPEKTVVHPLQSICSSFLAGTRECDPRSGSRAPGAAATGEELAARPLVPAQYASAPVLPDPAIQAALKPVLEQVSELQRRPLGVVAASSLTKAYLGESELGNLIADSLLWAVPEAQVAIHNSGGIRAEVAPGPITFGEVYAVMPFDNRVTLVTMTGAQLRELLDVGFSGRHGVAQIAGLRVVVDPRRARPVVSLAFADGRPVEPEARVGVVTNDYLAGGGSGTAAFFASLPPGAVEVREQRLREAIAGYLEDLGRQGLVVDDPARPLLDPAHPRATLLAPYPER
ncbi:MAG: bifunctional UDP-sugar hydrolase/5'-nucleotidase [Myxococcota bacterium]|jgi:5'-nucleotidase|nr:bifunctional UDP-sugar hydrolase/5'-nucleotidase [Myxococcota bacterium]